jgi:hypothetical protein
VSQEVCTKFLIVVSPKGVTISENAKKSKVLDGLSLKTMLRRIPVEVAASAARAVWANQETADYVSVEANRILFEAAGIKLRFFNGKSVKCVLGGLFYLLGYRFAATRTQREIADKLCTTEVSVRRSYRNWLIEFPQFFTDIENRFGQQSSPQF